MGNEVDYSRFSRYTVTEDGRIFGLDGKPMRTCIDKDGYEVVNLRDDSKKKYMVKVHRLVATRYIPTSDHTLTVNHKDGNRLNNSVSNLEWLSISDNLRHSWKILKRKHFQKRIVNSNGESFNSAKEAADHYGVKISAISNCALGRTGTCVGMKWRYL